MLETNKGILLLTHFHSQRLLAFEPTAVTSIQFPKKNYFRSL